MTMLTTVNENGVSTVNRTTKKKSGVKSNNDRDNIQVAVRIRPFLGFEAGNRCCVRVPPGNEGCIELDSKNSGSSNSPHKFTFDSTFDSQSTQDDVFEKVVVPLIGSCLEGHNATVLAYGQTGSGKTHSILGDTSGDGKEAGIIPRAFDAIFASLDQDKSGSSGETKLQFLEIYGEDIRDLLCSKTNSADASSSLPIRDGTHNSEPIVIGATQQQVRSSKEALLFLSKGMLRRVVRSTDMNSESSRSHAIMSLILNGGRNRFNFVDLAGSERIKRTNVSGQGLKEGININKGLLVLGNVISALASSSGKKSMHIPYRDSKLTRLLRGSLGGHHKTLMIACVSPSGSNTEETLNTLRYANRAKHITNKAKLSQSTSPAEQVADLKLQLSLIALALINHTSHSQQHQTENQENHDDFQSVLQKLSKNQHVATSKLKQSLNQWSLQNQSNQQTLDDAINNDPSTNHYSAEEFEKLKQENESLQTQLTEYKEQVVEQLRLELEQSKQENINAQEEIIWLKDEISVLKKSDPILNSETSVDFTEDTVSDDSSNVDSSSCSMLQQNLISRDTYESIIRANKIQLHELQLEIKDREDERDKIAITLCGFQSEKQCMTYVQHALTETIESNQSLAARKKNEIEQIKSVGPPKRMGLIQRLTRKQANGQAAKDTTATMKKFHAEKLGKMEDEITARENELKSIEQDLNVRMSESQVIISIEQNLQEQIGRVNEEIKNLEVDQEIPTHNTLEPRNLEVERNLDEAKLVSLYEKREKMKSELVKIDSDATRMTESVLSIKKQQVQLRETIEELKSKHIQYAESVGLPSVYNSNDSDGDSVSEVSLYSCDSSTIQAFSSAGEYEEKLKELENEIKLHAVYRYEAEQELNRLQLDMLAIDEMKSSLTEKLLAKENNLASLKEKEQEIIIKSQKQEGELAKLIPEAT